MEHHDNKDEVGNDVPPAPQFPTIDWNIQVSDKHGNPVNVLLEPPNPPPFHFDASWEQGNNGKNLLKSGVLITLFITSFILNETVSVNLHLANTEGTDQHQTSHMNHLIILEKIHHHRLPVKDKPQVKMVQMFQLLIHDMCYLVLVLVWRMFI
ncbi:uncharacterized protein LOC113294377 [Papaver somniferum]|uniref:uncharacterized protein LOC113294377 n=1 Tax=Papaver somniferum TaxID=3469 RepID=UPI000E6FBE42|nr:uncharacterized protein LOC113294377 [Papaver somniferum]